MKPKTKKILTYAGKTVATIVCPPAGLALWPKDRFNKVMCSIFGVMVSGIFSMGMMGLSDKKIYDSPLIRVGKSPSSLLNFGQGLISPIWCYIDGVEKTVLSTEKGVYYAHGDDVISFNNGKYNLNFGLDRKVGVLKGNSVQDNKELVGKYEQELDAYLKEGNLFKARKAGEKLGDARANLETITKRYNKTKQVFQEAVDKMNSEIKCLDEKLQG